MLKRVMFAMVTSCGCLLVFGCSRNRSAAVQAESQIKLPEGYLQEQLMSFSEGKDVIQEKARVAKDLLGAAILEAVNLLQHKFVVNDINFQAVLKTVTLTEVSRLAFGAQGSIVVGGASAQGSTGGAPTYGGGGFGGSNGLGGQSSNSEDLGKALFKAGFALEGAMSRFKLNFIFVEQNAQQQNAQQTTQGNQHTFSTNATVFDFWSLKVSASATTDADASMLLSTLIKAPPTIVERLAPILKRLAEARIGASLGYWSEWSPEIARRAKWSSGESSWLAYIIVRDVFSPYCKIRGWGECGLNDQSVTASEAVTEDTIEKYKVMKISNCISTKERENIHDIYSLYGALPSDSSVDLFYLPNQKVYLYELNKDGRFARVGDFWGKVKDSRFRNDARKNCGSQIGVNEKCAELKFGVKFNNNWGLCADINKGNRNFFVSPIEKGL